MPVTKEDAMERAATDAARGLRPLRPFPAGAATSPFQRGAMERVPLRMGSDKTVHGFRSPFRDDCCGNETSFPRKLTEQSSAHVNGDEMEQADRLRRRA